MKLHLNLTLRRAVLAAMALIAVHTTQAQDIVIEPAGSSTLTGDITWAGIVNFGDSTKEVDCILKDGTFHATDSIYIGGKGYGAKAEYGNNGTVTVTETATLSAKNSINVANTQETREDGTGIVGTLNVDGGKVTAGTELAIGVNKGSGRVYVTNGGTITVGDSLKMGYWKGGDSNYLSIVGKGSSITVGEAGGNTDTTCIGHETYGSISISNGASATFYGQTIIGENAGGYGYVTVTKDDILSPSASSGTVSEAATSTLTLGTKTILGLNAGAEGCIYVDGSKVTGTEMVIGSAGMGALHSMGNSSIELKTLFLGQSEGSEGYLSLEAGDEMTISNALTIGNAGTGKAEIIDAKLDITKNLIIGNTGTGTLETIGASAITVGGTIALGSGSGGTGEMTIGSDSTLAATGDIYAGNDKGTSTGKVTNEGKLTAANAYIMGADSFITNKDSMEVKDTTIFLGKLKTELGGITSIAGKLEVSSGSVTNDGTLTAGNTSLILANVTTGTGSETTIKGDLTVLGGTTTIGGTLTADSAKLTSATLTTGVGSTTDIKGKLEVSGGSVTNDGTMNAGDTKLTNTALTTGAGSSTTIAGKLEVFGGSATISGELEAVDTFISQDAKVEIAMGGSLTATGNITSAASITNYGNITNSQGALMVLAGLSGTGQVQNDGNWFVYGSTQAGIITNNGSITIQGAGNINATSVNGDITIIIDKYSVSTATDGAVVARDVADNTDNVKIKIDLSDAYALTGKSIDFVKDAADLASFETTTNGGPITYTEGWQADWINGIFSYTEEGSNKTTRLHFTTNTNDTANAISGIDFATVSQHTTYTDATDTSKSVEIVTEVKSTEAELVDSSTTTITPSTDTQVEDIDKAATIQTATITTGSATSSSEDHKIAFSKDVEVDLSTVESKVEITTNTVIAKDSTDEILLDAIGHTITISGNVTYTGKGDSPQLGFKEIIEGNEKKDLGEVTIGTENYKLKELDVLVVAEDATVTFQDVNMHITHAAEFKAGSTVTFEGCNIEFGGTIDHNIFKEVIVKDTAGNALKDENGEEQKHVVESDNHLTTKSSSEAGTTIILKNTTIKFKEIKDDENEHIGSVVLPDTVIETAPDCTLGGAKKDGYMTLHFENSHIGGSGKLENAIISGGKLRVGSSPTTRTATDILVQNGTIIEFNIITNSKQWISYTGDSSQLSPTGHASGAVTNGTDFGAISQLEVTGPVTLNNVVFKIGYETGREDAGNYIFESTTDTSTLRKFEDGDSIQFIVFNGGSITGTFGIDYDSLPALADEEGTWWDFSTLLKDGKITVISELMEDPGRIANTLLSAGHTVLDFGRLSEAQAELRAKGTTRTWGSAIANFDSIDSKDGATGYDYNAWGGAVGVDHAFTDRTVVGIALGRTYGENEPEEGNGYYDGGSIDQDGTMVGLYGTHKFKTKGVMSDVKFNAFAAYGWFDNESTRNGLRSGAPATASWDSDAWVLSASLSRDITTDHDIVFSTYAGVEYTKATMDDFIENGARYNTAYTCDEDYSNLAVKVGVTVSKSFGGFTPYVGIAYVHDVKRDIPTVTAVGRRVITEEGCVPGRSAVQLKAGANWKLTETLDIFAGYSAEIRDNATEHNANLGMGLTF